MEKIAGVKWWCPNEPIFSRSLDLYPVWRGPRRRQANLPVCKSAGDPRHGNEKRLGKKILSSCDKSAGSNQRITYECVRMTRDTISPMMPRKEKFWLSHEEPVALPDIGTSKPLLNCSVTDRVSHFDLVCARRAGSVQSVQSRSSTNPLIWRTSQDWAGGARPTTTHTSQTRFDSLSIYQSCESASMASFLGGAKQMFLE